MMSSASKNERARNKFPLIYRTETGEIPKEIKMTWEIVLGIISLMGMIGLVIGWTSKIAGTLSQLSTAVDNLNATVKEFKGDQSALIEHVSHHDVMITRHDAILSKHEEQIKELKNSDK